MKETRGSGRVLGAGVVSAHRLKGAQAGSGIARGLGSQQGAVLASIFHCLDLAQKLYYS